MNSYSIDSTVWNLTQSSYIIQEITYINTYFHVLHFICTKHHLNPTDCKQFINTDIQYITCSNSVESGSSLQAITHSTNTILKNYKQQYTIFVQDTISSLLFTTTYRWQRQRATQAQCSFTRRQAKEYHVTLRHGETRVKLGPSRESNIPLSSWSWPHSQVNKSKI